jgi:hypothetical protein
MTDDERQKPDHLFGETGITPNEIYKEQYAHFRGMNDTLYKIPPLFTAVIGGLWYFAVSNTDSKRAVASAVFAFTAVTCICFVNVMARFRQAFNGYLDNLNVMDGDMKITTKRGKFRVSTITTVQILLWIAAALSVAGMAYPYSKLT